MSSSMKFRARSRSAVSIGSNQLSKSSPSTEQAAAFMLSFVMAWSPVRRSNAGIRWVETPGDYATLNSNHSRDATRLELLPHTGDRRKPNLVPKQPTKGPMIGCEGHNHLVL